MARYIKADALIEDFLDFAEANKGTYHEEGFKNAITVVEMQPTADVVERKDLDKITETHEQIGYEKGYRDGYAQANVEVVRCKDCIYSQDKRTCNLPYGENGYCPFGERRGDE